MSSPRQLAVRDKVKTVEAEEMVKMLYATLASVNPRQLKKTRRFRDVTTV